MEVDVARRNDGFESEAGVGDGSCVEARGVYCVYYAAHVFGVMFLC